MARIKIAGRARTVGGTEFERAFPDWSTREFADKCSAYENARQEVIGHNRGRMLNWDARPPKGASEEFKGAFERMEKLENEIARQLGPLDYMAGHQPSLRTLGGHYALTKYQMGIAKLVAESRALAAQKTADAQALRRNAELEAKISVLEEQLRQTQSSQARLEKIAASARRAGRPPARKG